MARLTPGHQLHFSWLTPPRWPPQWPSRCCVSCIYEGDNWVSWVIRSPKISAKRFFQKWAQRSCAAVIFKPSGRRTWPHSVFGEGSVIGESRTSYSSQPFLFSPSPSLTPVSRPVVSEIRFLSRLWSSPHTPLPNRPHPGSSNSRKLVNFHGLGAHLREAFWVLSLKREWNLNVCQLHYQAQYLSPIDENKMNYKFLNKMKHMVDSLVSFLCHEKPLGQLVRALLKSHNQCLCT